MIILIISSIAFVFLIIRFVVVCANFISAPLLPKSPIETTVEARVSILIPVRNEEKNIPRLLNNLTQLTDNNIVDILFLDDHSTDNTKAMLAECGQPSPLIRIIDGEPLPTGWTGKNWACHQLAQYANGNYLLYLDADVSLTSGVVAKTAMRMENDKLDLLSIFPDQRMESPGEKLIVPLMHYLLLTLLPLRLVRTSSFSSLSAANGQFMMFSSAVYKKYMFHLLVKDNVLDDVNIMKKIKDLKLKGEVLLANGQVHCHMYNSGAEAFTGFSKNLYPGFGKNIVGFQIYFILIFWLWGLFWTGAPVYLLWCSLALIGIIRILISKLAGQSVIDNLLLHPVQMVLYVCIGFNSMYLHIFNKTTWKGRKLP